MNRKNLNVLVGMVVGLLVLDWVLGALITSGALPSWLYLLANLPFGIVYVWTEAHWVGTYYEIGGRIVQESVIAAAQLAAVGVQAVLYFGLWLLWKQRRLLGQVAEQAAGFTERT